jgi:hypothetical protein
MTLDTVEVTAPRENAERSTRQVREMLVEVFAQLSLLCRCTVPPRSPILRHRRFRAVVTDECRRCTAMAVRVRRETRRGLLVHSTTGCEHRAELAAASRNPPPTDRLRILRRIARHRVPERTRRLELHNLSKPRLRQRVIPGEQRIRAHAIARRIFTVRSSSTTSAVNEPATFAAAR